MRERLPAGSEDGLGHATVESGVRELETRQTVFLAVSRRERVLGVGRAHGLRKGELAGGGVCGDRAVRGRGEGRRGVVGRVGWIKEIVGVYGRGLLADLDIVVGRGVRGIRLGILVVIE